jgi:hypothetical protein
MPEQNFHLNEMSVLACLLWVVWVYKTLRIIVYKLLSKQCQQNTNNKKAEQPRNIGSLPQQQYDPMNH